jgi:uncharacterized membrane protein YkoI
MVIYGKWAMAAAVCAAGAFAAEQRVKMEDLPAAVRNTVTEQSKGAQVRGLSKEIEKGKVLYEAELKVNGHHRDLLISADGTVLEVEEDVALGSLPPAVKAAYAKRAANGKIESVESVSKGGQLVAYEARIRVGGKVSEVKLSPAGAPVE